MQAHALDNSQGCKKMKISDMTSPTVLETSSLPTTQELFLCDLWIRSHGAYKILFWLQLNNPALASEAPNTQDTDSNKACASCPTALTVCTLP